MGVYEKGKKRAKTENFRSVLVLSKGEHHATRQVLSQKLIFKVGLDPSACKWL